MNESLPVTVKALVYLLNNKFEPADQPVAESVDVTATVLRMDEHKFRLDYLCYDWYSEDYLATSLMPRMNRFYGI